ncbi:hypothetical protein FVE85_0569 [Porphyridium purpureum]|uniref:Uncharacterized protein n=1 Tax=Porphyridium purpureum TaxID=35688 RepID=A0A5J4Z0Q1_PORPP|nr:hypothetical protein FVE85_0569 [Porphyridium purpureum]|eukprot:POR6319..scf208_2
MISDRIRIIDVVPVNQSDVASTKQFVPNIGNQDSCTFLLPDGDADMDSSPFVYDLYVSRESRQHASRILPLDSYPTVEIPPERERADSLSAKHTHGVVLADSRHAHVFGMPVPQGNENTSESSFDTTDEDSNISDKTVDGSVDYPSTPSPSDAEAEHEIGVETGGYTEDWDEHEQELEFGPDFSQHVDELYDLQKMRLDMNGPQEDSIPVAFRANVASKRDAVHRKVDSSTAYEPTGACATQSSSSNGSATDTEDEDDEEECRELERLKERFALTLSRAAATPTATATRDRELTSSE